MTNSDDFVREHLTPPPADEPQAKAPEAEPTGSDATVIEPRPDASTAQWGVPAKNEPSAPPSEQDTPPGGFDPSAPPRPSAQQPPQPTNAPRPWPAPPERGPFAARPQGTPPPQPGPPPPPRPAPPSAERTRSFVPLGENWTPPPALRDSRPTDQLPRDTRPVEPEQQHQPPPPPPRENPQSGDPRWQDSQAAPAPNWSYVDGIRSSELVPSRKIPPARGWRLAVLKATFGLVNLGQSPDEREQAALEAKIRSHLRGQYKIGVLGKGGVGKTTVAASVGSILAELRQDDRVVAIDADTAFGKLGSRIDPQAAGSYWELAADEHLDTFADVRSRVGNNSSGLFVLAGEATTARRRVLDPAIYREAAQRLDRHFTISIIDCGSTMDSPVTQEVLRDLDALIVVSSAWVDGASAAGQTMEWLANRGLTGLLHRTVVVLNDSDGHADKRTRSILVQQFARRGQTVIEVPFDSHIRPGGVISVGGELSPKARRKFSEIAAAIAEHFAATTDAPRDRR